MAVYSSVNIQTQAGQHRGESALRMGLCVEYMSQLGHNDVGAILHFTLEAMTGRNDIGDLKICYKQFMHTAQSTKSEGEKNQTSNGPSKLRLLGLISLWGT